MLAVQVSSSRVPELRIFPYDITCKAPWLIKESMVDSMESAELDNVFVEFSRWAKAYTDSTPTLERVQEERAVERGYLDKETVTELRTLVVKYLESGWSSSDVQRYLSLINTIDDALDLMRMSDFLWRLCGWLVPSGAAAGDGDLDVASTTADCKTD